MAFCKTCGKEIPPGSASCPHCGHKSPPPPPKPARKPKTSGLAVASLILSVLGIVTLGLTAVIGLVLGIVAMAKIKKSGGTMGGSGLALAGVIVAVPVIFLSVLIIAISVPNFLRFRKLALASEAKTNLNAIYTAEEHYFEKHNEYGQTFASIEWSPEGNTLYTYYLCDDVIEPTSAPKTALPPGLERTCEAGQYQVIAVGNLDHDDYLDLWTINQYKYLDHVQDDVKN